MSARIDAAAADAGRSPAEIRRLLNVEGGIEPERLAELTLEHGFSTFVMAVSSAEDVQRFALETAPRGPRARRRGPQRRRRRPVAHGARTTTAPARFEVVPTADDGERAAATGVGREHAPERPRRPTPIAATRPSSRPPAST